MAALCGTRAGSAALQHREGWSQLFSDEMEVRKLIRKPLQPARPIRRAADAAPLLMVNFRTEIMDCFKEEIKEIKDHYSLWCSFGQLNGILKDPVVPEPPEIPQKANKQDRITYSRDFLIQLSSLSVSRQRPNHLPNHPVVLERPLYDLYKSDPFSSRDVPS